MEKSYGGLKSLKKAYVICGQPLTWPRVNSGIFERHSQEELVKFLKLFVSLEGIGESRTLLILYSFRKFIGYNLLSQNRLW